MPVGRGHDVLLDRHVQEQTERLERAGDTAARDPVRVEPDDRLPLEDDLAAVRRVDAGDQVEERRLAGAVRPDDADDLTFVHDEVEAVDAGQAAERLGQARHLEQRLWHQTISTRCFPNKPCGRTAISATSIAPIRMNRETAGCGSMTFSQTTQAK